MTGQLCVGTQAAYRAECPLRVLDLASQSVIALRVILARRSIWQVLRAMLCSDLRSVLQPHWDVLSLSSKLHSWNVWQARPVSPSCGHCTSPLDASCHEQSGSQWWCSGPQGPQAIPGAMDTPAKSQWEISSLLWLWNWAVIDLFRLLYCILFYCILLYSSVFYCVLLCSIVFYCIHLYSSFQFLDPQLMHNGG